MSAIKQNHTSRSGEPQIKSTKPLTSSEAQSVKKIAFVHRASLSAFKKNDLDILARHFDVRAVHYKGLIRGFFPLLKAIVWSDLTFSWFAGDHALLAALLAKTFRKKSIVVAGGGEVAKVPEIGYGGMLSPVVAWIVKNALKYSTKVLAVSQFNRSEILKYANHEKVELIYNGIACDRFRPKGAKEGLVVTVASLSQLLRKGIGAFIEAAKYLPNITFVLIGRGEDKVLDELRSVAGPNVIFAGFVPDERLEEYYRKASVYCQLSYHEAFGVALAEAMLCECVPVVTDKGAIPEVVGDTGFYVPYRDAEATAEAISKALNSDKGKQARERIKNLFPITKREEELLRVVNSLNAQKK